MSDDTTTDWEQPEFEDTLEATAVELITAVVQQVFTDLDPVALVEAEASH
ncbi:MAG: hypothetical protein HZB48_03895, partial [Actinobacteria bacterium]|nr:hypothetical protein [Actinomycetota bacterium]